ncbi:hypothetical protein Lfu02_51060 [Longispora fulva]|uniref:Peptidase MA-like domain-containing protein n=1 Tax=Longispora fulva TaxID=619741 RepID=A0A8J7GXL8_9ACTN|nr:hypothetical protein [Longispora fulva]MBG6140999.1 hypothetical protein [Longispora fulva]GIG60734.1 hypothetical protein Lfu02_51060 [Longispora fulva]
MAVLVLLALSLTAPPGSAPVVAHRRLVGGAAGPAPRPWIDRSSDTVLILGHAGGERLMSRILWPATGAVEVVTEVWGSWERHVTIIVPADVDELRALIDEDGDLTHVAALTDPSGRVVVNPDVFGALSPAGRQVVLTHEITHAAARGTTSDLTPYWLAEGLAEYVAHRDSPTRDRSIAKELADEVRVGRLPVRLPARHEFAGERQAQAYQEAWLICRFMVERAGEETLLRVYRRVSAGADSDRVFREELGLTEEHLVEHWREYVERRLG